MVPARNASHNDAGGERVPDHKSSKRFEISKVFANPLQ